MRNGMARMRATRVVGTLGRESSNRVRIAEECLELDAAGPREIDVLRRWLGRVNGRSYPQPFLVEDPPGRFCLYVGDSAERVRTRQGMS